jgi:preprotein translocase subunit SecA
VDAVPALESFDFESLRGTEPDDATDLLVPELEAAYKAREAELGTPIMRELERYIVLQVVDNDWKEQLHNMDVLRQGIGLRGYGQRNPLQEYAFEAFNLFEEMKSNIRLQVAKLLFRVQVQQQAPLPQQRAPQAVNYQKPPSADGDSTSNSVSSTYSGSSGAVSSSLDFGNRAQPKTRETASQNPFAAQQPQGPVGPTKPIRADAKVGRNDPCPCGSGKKFKHCHGREVGAVSGD